MPHTMTTPAVLSPQEVADALDMSRRQVYRWLRSGELPHQKIDGNYKITEDQLVEKVGDQLATEVFRRAGESREPPTE